MDFLKWNENMAVSLCPQCASFYSVCTAYLFMCVYVSTLCVCLWSLCFVFVSKPQKVKTSVVETPPLMRAVISQTSDQPSEKLREDHHAKNEDQSLSRLQEPNTKQCGNDPFMWSRSQPGRYQDLLSAKDHLSINTHLFPERQSAVLSQKAIQERFSLSVDSGIKPCQGDPDQPEPCQPHANLIQPDCSQRQDAIHHHEDSDVRNGYKSER